ncbi:MAG: SIMPL domain-containing protein [Bacteroidales bacterium]|nr:SIMPL domain-containing protein [Bacteroidales bacterium]MBQ7458535.1 SIMPL domain-containing protein [Bacteroidales bacterium]MBQ9529826.1 SIMPL domain-containing protein [Bacteroidales bacterium]
MENKGNFLAGLAIMVGLICVALSIPKAVNVLNSSKRTVSVRGLCEKEVPADKVIWPLQYSIAGDDLTALYAKMESNNADIKAFLKAGGIDETEITTSKPDISDLFTQEYGGNNRRFRYVVKATTTVSTNKVDKVLALMDNQGELIRKGITLDSGWDSRPTFSFEGLNAIKPEMIEEATKNARASAQKFADDSGSRLGKIRNATQGYFTIDDRDSNTPQIKRVRVVTNVDYSLKN